MVPDNVNMIADDEHEMANTDLRELIEKALEEWGLPTGATEQDESVESGAWMRWMALVPPKDTADSEPFSPPESPNSP